MEEYNIYVKLTNACNLKCKHCYNSIMENSDYMSEQILYDTSKYIQAFATAHKNATINIQLHGGEPCMYDINKLIWFIKSIPQLNCKFSITTNLAYELSDKHIQLFKLMKPYDSTPYIMTSWDYKIRFDDKSLSLWEKNIKVLQDSNIVVQPIVCITTMLVDGVSPKQLFDYFEKLNIKNINFERITATGNAVVNNLKPLNRQVDNWLYEAFCIYENNDFHIPLFGNLKCAMFGKYNGCRARQCMSTVTTINPDGSLATCPNMPLNSIGTIYHEDFGARFKLCACEKNINTNCKNCNYLKYCNGDCCQLEYDKSGCPGLKLIIAHLSQ